jgi:hypothetical protein
MTASDALATHTSPVFDPYTGLTVPAYSGCTKTRFALDAGATERASPGVYCGGILVAGGAALDLAPGTYILDEGSFEVGENATVKGRDVTIILTSRNRSNHGVVDFHRGATIELSAPASGSGVGAPGIALWVDATAPAAANTLDGGGTQIIDGAVYLPSQEVRFSGGSPSGTRCSQLIARTVSFTGDAYFRHDCDGAGISDPVPPLRFAEE